MGETASDLYETDVFLCVGVLGYTARAREWDVKEANEVGKEN